MLLGLYTLFLALPGFGSRPAFSQEATYTLNDTARRASASVVRIDVVVPVSGGVEGRVQPRFRGTNGAGFVFDEAGLIVTAAHVVADALDIRIVIAPGDIRPARLLGLDRLTDVAILSIDGPLPPPLQIAEAVPPLASPIAAIGAPYGMDRAVSFGVVSGVGRARRMGAPAILLQHDAAINPGNSGGPVIDDEGRVVGLNTGIPDGQFEFAGISFALEGPILAQIVDELRTTGAVRRGALGAVFRGIDPLLAATLDRPIAGAAIVTDLDPGGAAAEAGLVPSDIILAVNGHRLTDLSDLLRMLDAARAGDELRLEIQAGLDAHLREIVVKLPPAEAPPPAHIDVRTPPGITLAEGAPVTFASVVDGSPAAASGLAQGDVLLGVDLVPVRDVEQARRLLAVADGLTSVLVQRGDGSPRLLVLGTDPADAGVLGGNSLGVLSARR